MSIFATYNIITLNAFPYNFIHIITIIAYFSLIRIHLSLVIAMTCFYSHVIYLQIFTIIITSILAEQFYSPYSRVISLYLYIVNL